MGGVTHLDEFVRLCENLHPHTGEKLTMRQNTTRTDIGHDGLEHASSNRRVFYDFTFSPPKSVSIAAMVGDDTRIVEAHEQAVNEALRQLQSFAATRVRKKGECTDRLTGNIVAAVFQHETSRALDPHLHSHCILFNATFDPVEKKWKALQNHEMLAAQKFVENVYYRKQKKPDGYPTPSGIDVFFWLYLSIYRCNCPSVSGIIHPFFSHPGIHSLIPLTRYSESDT